MGMTEQELDRLVVMENGKKVFRVIGIRGEEEREVYHAKLRKQLEEEIIAEAEKMGVRFIRR